MIDEAALLAAGPRDKPYKLYPGNGLYLIVQPNGAKWWRYNVRRNGINTTLSLGAFPAVSMAEALAERGIIRTQARMGIHPAAARRAARKGATLGCAGAAFAISLSADGALSVTIGEQTLHMTRYQTEAVRAALLALR
ncbi:phage integrase family site specific recombinase [mine drainage metagenome]|uniref:Phage integrase family site specific recombinase n=2 Tax=mine drainage metagenome TaxID=410659 RepID=T1BMD7_9ZZZZ